MGIPKDSPSSSEVMGVGLDMGSSLSSGKQAAVSGAGEAADAGAEETSSTRQQVVGTSVRRYGQEYSWNSPECTCQSECVVWGTGCCVNGGCLLYTSPSPRD